LVRLDGALAAEFPVTARLFISNVSVEPEDLNTELTAQSLKEIDKLNHFGAEATYSFFRFFEGGFRYVMRQALVKEVVDNPVTNYRGELQQDSVFLVARVPLIKTSYFRTDIFGAFGGTNTSFNIKSATLDGAWSRKGSEGWFGAPITGYGASVGMGFKGFYLVVEGGFETNKVEKLHTSGTVNTNVESIDLSGSYFSIGLMFDGVKATKR